MEKITRVDRDILYTKFLLDGKQHNWYDKIYYSTNEDLESLLDVFDVEGKDVLSVTGSGDQAFHFHSKKANNVDLFDINRLTIHYYYLRVWVLNHLDNYYPNMDFASYIEDLLKRVIPTTEEENISLLYWKRFIKEIPKDKIIELFCKSSLYNLRPFNGNIESLKEKVSSKKLSFSDVDISEPITKEITNKYDIVYVSNIRDWIKNRGKSWDIYSENLYNLLKDNGVVLSSNVVIEGPHDDEKRIFEKNFSYEPLEKKETKSIRIFERPGYVYIKKKVDN